MLILLGFWGTQRLTAHRLKLSAGQPFKHLITQKTLIFSGSSKNVGIFADNILTHCQVHEK
jgi:hypothetical protein